MAFAALVTLANAEWFSGAITQTIVFFGAQSYLQYQINKYEMQGDVDMTIFSYGVVSNVFISFLFCAISYAMFSSQAHLFVKNKRSVRQTEQMQDVLQEIDDGVIILEEKPDEDIEKEESFINVEFANSFMQLLFGTNFKSDSPVSAKRIQELAKEPIKSKTSEQLTGQQDNNSAENLEPTTSLQKLISSAEDNSPTVSKDLFLVINAPRQVEENTNESTRALRPKKSSELDKDAYVVQASVRKLVFNDKECYILILKNLTSAFRFKKASEME